MSARYDPLAEMDEFELGVASEVKAEATTSCIGMLVVAEGLLVGTTARFATAGPVADSCEGSEKPEASTDKLDG